MKLFPLAVMSAALVGVVGCGGPAATTVTPATNSAAVSRPAPPPTDAQLTKARVNEMGGVPILEYHAIGPGKTSMDRSVKAFQGDLERLYKEGYRPVNLSDVLDNRIAVPLGTTPVVLTFDDARPSQFSYLPDGTIDPNCAVGILQAFAKARPDFPVRGTFFVLPREAFGQPKLSAKKMQELLAMGCEIGNHTVTHRSLKKLSDSEVQQELATCVAVVQKLAPEAKVDTVALPMGIAPRHRALLASGEYKGQRYANRAALLVGANPAPSPASPKFDPMRLPRIQACELPMGSTDWLDQWKQHPERRYVSDGDPKTVAVPQDKKSKVDASKLNGATLRTY